MYISTLLPATFLLSVAAAQTFSTSYTSTSTLCAAEAVFQTCLSSTGAIASACASNDYGCLCQKWTDVLTCYNQCPNDPGRSSVQTSVTTYCIDASQYPSATSAVVVTQSAASASTASTATGSTDNSSSGAVRVSGGPSPTATGSGASATASAKSGASKDLTFGAGTMWMGFVGLLGAIL